ncbi:MAG: L,D-transpeptidase family protein [Woeseiaceae bacterium]|nr:L,D-transpeptidase family protein [Woeseiaceae bacterium]
MKSSSIHRIVAILATTALLGACTAIQDFLAPLGGGSYQDRIPQAAEADLQEPLNRNFFVLESPEQSVIGEPQIVYTSEENTFSDLAREYGLGFDEMVAANPDIDPWLPGADVPVLLPTQYVLPDVPRRGLVLNIASKRLFYFPEVADGQPVQVLTYPIGIGRVGWETPLGDTEVVAKAKDPVWYVPASVRRENRELGYPDPAVVQPGPDNPLGHRVLKLAMPGYLIHGTNQPYGVGMRVSHGCVRLYPENIETLYELVELGEPVTIINEPYLAGWRNGELYLESHLPLADDDVMPGERMQKIFEQVRNESSAFNEQAEQDEAREVASYASGVPIRVLKSDIGEVYARARVVRNTVEPDPNMPTIDEVRALLDEPVESEIPVEPIPEAGSEVDLNE